MLPVLGRDIYQTLFWNWIPFATLNSHTFSSLLSKPWRLNVYRLAGGCRTGGERQQIVALALAHSCWQRGSSRRSKWILSKNTVNDYRPLIAELWLIYAEHCSSCLLMQLFTYLVTGDPLVFQSGCVANKIRQSLEPVLIWLKNLCATYRYTYVSHSHPEA